MPKSPNQKLKLLYLFRILHEKTDENHSLTMSQIIDELGRYGISAERKSIYDDLEALRVFGVDIACIRSKNVSYCIAGRGFELPELKLLADAVASSKFITEKKSEELIRKIGSLTSVYEAAQLRRQVYVSGRVKTMNEKIYYNVDKIHQAIARNRQISFRYFEYTVEKEKRYRNDGEDYTASPFALSWDDEYYYLIALYDKRPNLSHFRVDKMECIEILEENRSPLPDGKQFNPAEYSRKVFNMFGGEEERIRLKFDNSLIGVVLDRFGKDVMVMREGEHSFIVTVDALISPPLLGWLFSFGDKVKVLSPESLAEMMRDCASKCASRYT
ncbi:MAG: helix-turn-helix transcriptional regulator [Oscillospiraceae bacterium]